jgi:predicted MPP superfamily phosphohydrolase
MPSAAATAARLLGGLALAGAASVAYGAGIERNAFALRRFTVPVLPAGARPIRVLQVSDLHLVPGQERKIAWVRDLARLRPDLVVNTGDNLSHADGIPGVLRALEPLGSTPGLFVLGSNDYYGPTFRNPARYLTDSYASTGDGRRRRLRTDELVAGMNAFGWVDLDNARTSLTLAGSRLDFVGVDDPHIRRDDYAAVAGPADPSAALTVGIVHAPYQRVLDAMTADGAGLVIAGHTHGGQLAVPLLGGLVTNCDLDRSRIKGVSRWWPGAGESAGAPRRGLDRWLPNGGALPSSAAPPDAAWLHVSAGLGTSRMAPVRFACRPEAALLTLGPRSKHTSRAGGDLS